MTPIQRTELQEILKQILDMIEHLGERIKKLELGEERDP